MKISAFLTVFCLTFLAHAAEARECTKPSLQPAFQNSEKEYGVSRDYYSSDEVSDPRQKGTGADSSIWLQRITSYEVSQRSHIAGQSGRSGKICNYDTAIEVLNEIETQLGMGHPYLKFWAENQNRVLASCASAERIDLDSLETSQQFPERAAGDLAYQNASLSFYTRAAKDEGGDQELEANFLAQAENAKSAMQGRAAIMALRMAYINGGIGHLINIAERLRSNPLSNKAYAYAEDVVFSAFWGYSPISESPEALEKRLHWLVDTSLERNVPAFSKESGVQQNFRTWRQRDARYQLGFLVGHSKLNEEETPAGWWFGADAMEEEYQESVRRVAHNEPYIDFLATHFVNTPLESWRWAFYDPESVIWKNSQVIANHALERFCAGDGAEWLYEGARLMPPGDPDIVWARDQLVNALDNQIFHQQQPFLRAQIHHQAVRLSLLAGEEATAANLLLRGDINFLGADGGRAHTENRYGYSSGREHVFKDIVLNTYRETLAWYAHQGLWDRVRQLIEVYEQTGRDNYDYSGAPVSTLFRKLAAQNLGEYFRNYRYVRQDADDPAVLLDLLPLKKLLEVAKKEPSDQIYNNERAPLAASVLLRAWLVGDKDTLQEAVQLYADRLPEQKGEVFRAFSGDRFDQALFVLRHQKDQKGNPQNPFDGLGTYRLITQERGENLHRWGGPWCQFDVQDYEDASAAIWEFAPEGAEVNRNSYYYYGRSTGLNYDVKKFAEARRKAYKNHPLWTESNILELQQLAAVAPGPQYLSEIIVDYAKWPNIWNRMMGRRADMPEALHLSVRTGYYGCHRGNDYGQINRQAYRLLHKDFPNTHWTQNTPYWYK